MVSGELRARPPSTEDQAKLVFTDLERDLERDRSSSSFDRNELLLSKAVREEPLMSDFWHKLDATDGEADTRHTDELIIYQQITGHIRFNITDFPSSNSNLVGKTTAMKTLRIVSFRRVRIVGYLLI